MICEFCLLANSIDGDKQGGFLIIKNVFLKSKDSAQF